MKIKVERSGGFAGIPIFNEMDAKDLPSTLVTHGKKNHREQKVIIITYEVLAKGAADHYTYKISIQDGTNRRVIECNQYNIQDDLKSLVKYIERISKKAK